ncbi:MAG: HDIG domain-containing protein [Ignavibacteria bacterium]|nr:HDIG domain-containing protein [Ignavibacteria bacterium]
MKTREEALALLMEFTSSPSLIKHAFAVEAAMRAYALRFGEDPDQWGLAGLLHDFDYERYPSAEEHPVAGSRILEERGYPEDLRRAILSHADHSGVPRISTMEKALFACDELCGFLTAVSYVRPDRTLDGLEVSSVRKKMKDKAFARAVSRDDLLRGPEELGLPFDEHVLFVAGAIKDAIRED